MSHEHGPSAAKLDEETQRFVADKLAKSYAESPKGHKKSPEWAAKKGKRAARKIDLTDPVVVKELRDKRHEAIDSGLDAGPRQALARRGENGDWLHVQGFVAGTESEVGKSFRQLSKSPVDHLVAVNYIEQTMQVPVSDGPQGPAA